MEMDKTVVVDGDKITFPDSTEQTTKAVRSATLVVAANNSETKSKAQADYVCDGTDDHVQIQAAIDALPATGGEVLLLEGTYNIEVSLVLDSYQTLRGCGRNTILTTSTATVDIITATGSDGSEKVGILIADLCLDGNSTADTGIYFTYVNYSKTLNMWILDVTGWSGMVFENSDFNEIIGNTFRGSYEGIEFDITNNNIIVGNYFSGGSYGIMAWTFSNNTLIGNIFQGAAKTGFSGDPPFNNNVIVGNVCQGNTQEGIFVSGGVNNTISGNVCEGNGHEGIEISYNSQNNIISGNTCINNGATDPKYAGITVVQANAEHVIVGNQCEGNGLHGIHIKRSSYCTIVGNICNNQVTGDGINIEGSAAVNADYNNIVGNTCYNNASHGIEIVGGVLANYNVVKDNLLQGNITAPFADAGTNTRLDVYVVPFSHGSDPQDSGYEIDLDAEFARAWLRLPIEVQQVVRMKVYARSVVAEVHEMELEMVVKGGADNEPFGTHDGSIAQLDSTSVNFAADDIIFWINTEAGILALVGGDSVEVKVLHEAAEGDNCETDAFFRTVEIEYV